MEKILVLNIAGIGDCVDSLPALRRLRQAKPDTFIRLVVAEKTVPLARCCRDVNEVVGLPTSVGSAIPEWIDAPRWLWRVVHLRDRYRFMIDLYGTSSRLGRGWRRLLSLWTRAPLIGLDRQTADGPGLVRDQVDRSLEVIEKITPTGPRGSQSVETLFAGLRLPDEATTAVRTWLKEQSWGSLDGPLVAVALGGDRRTRHESPQRAERWLALLQAKWKIRPIIIGMKNDPGLPAGSSVIHVDRRGRWDIVQTAALIASADALVSTDSAPQHLASVWGTPTVVLLGPGDPIRYRPRFSNERFRQVRHEVPCAPCFYMVCPLRGADHHRCMSGIAPEQVVHAFGEVMANS